MVTRTGTVTLVHNLIPRCSFEPVLAVYRVAPDQGDLASKETDKVPGHHVRWLRARTCGLAF